MTISGYVEGSKLVKIAAVSIQGPDATAPGWSCHEPSFFPEWVEKVDATVAR